MYVLVEVTQEPDKGKTLAPGLDSTEIITDLDRRSSGGELRTGARWEWTERRAGWGRAGTTATLSSSGVSLWREQGDGVG